MKVYQTANWTPQDPCEVIRRPKGGGEMSVLEAKNANFRAGQPLRLWI